jgi:hypothetical protein
MLHLSEFYNYTIGLLSSPEHMIVFEVSAQKIRTSSFEQVFDQSRGMYSE